MFMSNCFDIFSDWYNNVLNLHENIQILVKRFLFLFFEKGELEIHLIFNFWLISWQARRIEHVELKWNDVENESYSKICIKYHLTRSGPAWNWCCTLFRISTFELESISCQSGMVFYGMMPEVICHMANNGANLPLILIILSDYCNP